jgi:SAM-dependent methyltransferase
MTVLDCGCGTGQTTMPLLDRFRAVVACDYSRRSLEVLRSRSSTDRIMLVQADVRRLPFRDDAFSRVLCANMLQHLAPTDHPCAASELRRVARSRLVVSVHHWSRGKRRAGWPKEERPTGRDWDYIYRFERRDLTALFPGSRVRAATFEGWIARKLWRLFPGPASRLGFGHMLIATEGRRWGSRPDRE